MVKRPPSQRGAALIIALVVIVLISLVVVSAYNLTSSNLKSVSNVQYRNEVVAAANRAIEQVVSGSFLNALNTNSTSAVDIDKDGTSEYSVTVAIPQCPMRVRRVALDAPSGYEVGGETTMSAGTYVSDFELAAEVKDTHTGAAVVVRQGIRVPMGEADYQLYVAPCGLTLMT